MSLLRLTNTTTLTTSTTTPNALRGKKPPTSITRTSAGKRSWYTSCEQQQTQGGRPTDSGYSTVDRRDILIGLGGIYGATTTFGKAAVGAPVQPPDLSKCHLSTIDDGSGDKADCCLSFRIHEFQPPPPSNRLRTRLPAHKLDDEYLAKFKEAVAKMKALPDDDPWNFMQQAKIHCAFCDGAYDQVGFPKAELQIHWGWLFLPWHRYYIYFWEKILGKLIGDPTFAIPYWNWDAPEAMYMPKIYLDECSPLYDDERNHDHFDALFDYRYTYGSPNPTPDEKEVVIINNLRYLYNIFTEGYLCPPLFMGEPVVAGEENPSRAAGSLENLHNVAHNWTGKDQKPYHDMGIFYTAARDPIFFGHHGNIDRLWDIYSTSRGGRVEFKDPNWLEASFVFYDENRELVKCKVRDCLNPKKLGYTYLSKDLNWSDINQSYRKLASKRKPSSLSLIPIKEFGDDPRILSTTIRALVRQPEAMKEDVEKVLFIDGIVLDDMEPARFDVFISKPLKKTFATDDLGEFVGSFVHVAHAPHNKSNNMTKSSMKLGITNLVKDIDANSSENLVVSFVPRNGEVTIVGVGIELCEED